MNTATTNTTEPRNRVVSTGGFGLQRCTSWMGHKWRTRRDLNSGFYHHGALARTGEMCERCAAVRFPETDDEYFAKLPEWLKNDPELLRPNVKDERT